jgi:penicillin-binding protein 1C
MNFWKRIWKWLVTFGIAVLLGAWLTPDFSAQKFPYASLVLGKNNEVLGAKVANDGQWRFRMEDNNSIPPKLKIALVSFEDQYFEQHPGINPVALLRALVQNFKKGRVVSGGSTLTMQVARMYHGRGQRTIYRKCREMLAALLIEIRYSKEEILHTYLAHAPYGGNIIGYTAASFRYFGKIHQDLTWAEAALLAILPNHPARLYPGKQESMLLSKRNRLLFRLYQARKLSEVEYRSACREPLPLKPSLLPQSSAFITEYLVKTQGDGHLFNTEIDTDIQEIAWQSAKLYQKVLEQNFVYHAGILIVETNTGKVKAYIGNLPYQKDYPTEGFMIDMAQAKRSTGSLLKPFLMASSLQTGQWLPNSLLADIPVEINGYFPRNNSQQFSGAVSLSQMVSRSLNVPAVKLLQQYGIERFYTDLKNAGIKTLFRKPEAYGLPLIVGGAEGTLFELVGLYASMGRCLLQPKADSIAWAPLVLQNQLPDKTQLPWSASCVYQTFQAMHELERPDSETGWRNMESSVEVAWKTGTSYGNKDAWSIGVTPTYTIGVWLGNANGDGRAELTGLGTAAPLLFELLRKIVRRSASFPKPVQGFKVLQVCNKSGFQAGEHCTETHAQEVHASTMETPLCYWCKTIFVNSKGFQADAACAQISTCKPRKIFNLPPAMEYYYKRNHVQYESLPAWDPSCKYGRIPGYIELVYPYGGTKVIVPTLHDGSPGKLVLQANAPERSGTLFWILDGEWVGETQKEHRIEVSILPGKHTLHISSSEGAECISKFEVLRAER